MQHLYLHVPFCGRRCSYCDFAIAVRRDIPGSRYVEGIKREFATIVPARGLALSRLKTLYLGGGTPSLLGAGHIAELIRWAADACGLETGAEVTVEANPDDVSPLAIDAWRAAGVNRVSLGVQSLDARTLEWMHRTHSPAAARKALTALETSGLAFSADLIFGLPDHLRANPLVTLDEVGGGGAGHVSAYGLTVEAGTALGKWAARGRPASAPTGRYADEFLSIHQRLTGQGFNHYEISNYALKGRESRHNLAYWARVPYLGLGPSAHSFDGTARWWNIRHWAAYIDRVESGGNPVAEEELLDDGQRQLEEVYLRLRTSAVIVDNGGLTAQPALEKGWLERRGEALAATPEGWLRLDELVLRLTTLPEGG